MKALLAFAFLVISLSKVAQAAHQENPTQEVGTDFKPIAHVCTKEEMAALFCPLDFTPVLGVFKDNTWQEFANGCEACATKDVKEYYTLHTCGPNYIIGGPCTLEYFPVCAISLLDEKLKEFGNTCDACSSGEVINYFYGVCPKLKGPHGFIF